MGNRAHLLSLPFAPIVFGEKPPSGAVAFANHSLPFFWATLFDATSIVRVNGVFGLAALRAEAGPRSERRLRACAAYFGWAYWSAAERWLAFLRSLGQPWIAVDVHGMDVGERELGEIVRRADAPPRDLALRADDAVVLAGVDHDDYSPPRPLRPLGQVTPSSLFIEASSAGVNGY